MTDILKYIFSFASFIIAAGLIFAVLTKLPQGPTIYFNQSNGRNFAFPLIPSLVFGAICLAVIYLYLL